MIERLKLWWALTKPDREEMPDRLRMAWNIIQGKPVIYRAEIRGTVNLGNDSMIHATSIDPRRHEDSYPAITLSTRDREILRDYMDAESIAWFNTTTTRPAMHTYDDSEF